MDVDGRGRGARGRTYVRPGASFGAGRGLGQGVCKFWIENACNKGDSCQWRHPVLDGMGDVTVGTSSGSKRPSSGMMQGGTANGMEGSSFPGDQSGMRRMVSARWGRGRGGGGRGSGPRRKPDEICRFWLRGSCKRGPTCDFVHGHTTAPDVEMMTELKGHEQAIRAIVLPANSDKLYTGGQDCTVRVWDCSTGQCTNVVQVGGDVGSLLSESGWLFVGLLNEVKCFFMATWSQHSLSGHKGQVHALAAANEFLLSGGQDGLIMAWKFNPASSLFELVGPLAGHTGAVLALQVASGRLYSGSMDKSIRVWDMSSGQCVHVLQGQACITGLLCWEQFLLSCSLDGTIQVWGSGSGGSGSLERTFTFPESGDISVPYGKGALALCGTMDANSKPVLICSYVDNAVRLFDLPAFTERGCLLSEEEVRVLHVGPGSLFFTGDSQGLVKVWRFLASPAPVP